MSLKGILNKHFEIIGIAACMIVGIAAIVVGIIFADSDTDAPAPGTSISYTCSGVPSSIPCSLAFPNNPAFQVQVMVIK